MLIVALAFILVFLFRDVLALASREHATLAHFAGYSLLMVAAVGLMIVLSDSRPGIIYSWSQHSFARNAVLIQVVELVIAFVLRVFALGRYSWIGCVLPAPAFLVVLFALTFAMQDRFIGLDPGTAVEIVTAMWLTLVGGTVTALCWLDNPWEDRKFANDFALMTSCTALIFVPFGFF